jgi:hypothetical protein
MLATGTSQPPTRAASIEAAATPAPDLRDRRQWGSRDFDGAVVVAVARSRLDNGVCCATASGEHHHRPTAAKARRDIPVGDLAAVHQYGDQGPAVHDAPATSIIHRTSSPIVCRVLRGAACGSAPV